MLLVCNRFVILVGLLLMFCGTMTSGGHPLLPVHTKKMKIRFFLLSKVTRFLRITSDQEGSNELLPQSCGPDDPVEHDRNKKAQS